MIYRIALIALAAANLALSGPALAQSAAQRGGALVKQHCAACHAIGASGESPNAKAPPLREIARKYKVEDLEEAFAEGVMVSHQATEMPPFTFDPPQIGELTAYLRSLKAGNP
ncbi:MAG: cytochrome c [Beijerinckiaceae bacterium]|nr:cytochrome c [Beijerinckiaceae bacterium]